MSRFTDLFQEKEVTLVQEPVKPQQVVDKKTEESKTVSTSSTIVTKKLSN
jgi:hypothetical protein